MMHLAKESIIGQNRDERIICFSNSAADFQRLSIKNRACDQTAKHCLYICVFKYARTVKQKLWIEAENREKEG